VSAVDKGDLLLTGLIQNVRQKLPDITTTAETQDLGDTVLLDCTLSTVQAPRYKTAGYTSRRFLEYTRDVEELPSSLGSRLSSSAVATDESAMDVDEHHLLNGAMCLHFTFMR
jgi:hypothetical protein